ncbi:DUF624 domain-containing protein [Fictibacillus sp. WQ 8-8]|uniref:YesL family protein n=1 Tax=Fictibacillus sp. WQ 8-8 TaxID=2938788 RepID=UPI00210D19EA|nr:DUF624 domain-containing protein [Fictibacillus sp. WQ 8-8]MCQ6264076.1 DUF624 domain-containing protein [Fictibacillus sp. WQ 8-8]
MNRENWLGNVYHLTDWIMRLAYLNLLWLAFTLLGCVLFGWAPATIAMHTVIRKWMMGEEHIKVFSCFWDTYKSVFLKSQKISCVLIILGCLLFVDLKFFMSGQSAVFTLGKLFSLQLIIGYFVVCSYIFSLYTNYKMNGFEMFKIALLLGLMYPVKTLLTLLGSFVFIMMFLAIPELTIFFGGSLFALWCTYSSNRVFRQKKNVFLPQRLVNIS